MRVKPRAIPRTKLNIFRYSGDYVDGIYQELSENKLELEASIQPYNGIRLVNDKDFQYINSSIQLFSNDEFKLNDTFVYNNITYKVKFIDSYFLGKLAHFEIIAFSYNEEYHDNN